MVNRLLSEATVDDPLAGLVEAITRKLEAGEPIDLAQYTDEYPAQVEPLRKLLPALEALYLAGHQGSLAADGDSRCVVGDAGDHGQLGDFRLIRELGRGGMGTVFEAEQISMGRRVALKVLPFAAIARENSLQRFRNEVRAAAALDHPHIVSIYSVGEERGVHYYAMQLVRGQTLADMIGELRKVRSADSRCRIAEGEGSPTSECPTIDSSVPLSPATKRDEEARISTATDSRHAAECYRTVARLGIQAAEALQHAHDQGVLHRDIKPSNLMLDREGELYVTDFGLARIEADAGMTMTGDMVGTLRYMAPEQALAKRVVVDHRADIYSLGATLYELLALLPAFGETDRTELLKQIAFEEPHSLRKLDRRIPAELETIVAKAMSKNRDDRYQSAQWLSDDLRAFLEHRPIKARPASIADRLRKWARRHDTLVRTMGIASVLLMIILVVGIVLVRAPRHELSPLWKRHPTCFMWPTWPSLTKLLKKAGPTRCR